MEVPLSVAVDREIAFPLDPKAAVETARQTQHGEAVHYAWDVVMAAAAQADKRMLGKPGREAGMHTQLVADLLQPYADQGITPATPTQLHDYHNGEVYANWGNRRDYQRDRHDRLFFAGLARRETIALADLDDDIRGAFEQAAIVQVAESYIADLSHGIADLIPSDDFPYRSLTNPSQAREFWDYTINGDSRRPGIMAAAAYSGIARERWMGSLRSIYGTDAPMAAQYMLAVLYLRTSERKSGETERELLTPLMQSFNTRDIDLIRQDLTDFARERLELVPQHTLKLLELDADELRRQRDAQTEAARWTVSRDEIEAEVYGQRPVGSARRFRSELDASLNKWAETNHAHVFIRDKRQLVLVGAVDKQLGSDRFNTETPHLIFVWLDKTLPDNPRVKFSVLPAREVFKEMRGSRPKTIDAGEFAPVVEEIAYYLLTTEPGRSPNSQYSYGAGDALVTYLRRRRQAESE